MRLMGPAGKISPIGAVVLGAAAGAVGTAAMDLVWFSRYRRGGGDQRLLAWETAEGVVRGTTRRRRVRWAGGSWRASPSESCPIARHEP